MKRKKKNIMRRRGCTAKRGKEKKTCDKDLEVWGSTHRFRENSCLGRRKRRRSALFELWQAYFKITPKRGKKISSQAPGEGDQRVEGEKRKRHSEMNGSGQEGHIFAHLKSERGGGLPRW